MKLSDEIQELIYNLDALVDGGCGSEDKLFDCRRRLDTALLRRAAIELKATTQDYLDAKRNLDEAKALLSESGSSLGNIQSVIEKVTKFVSAVERLL